MCKCTDFLTYLVSSSTIELLDLCLFSEEEGGVVQLSKEHSRFENWVTKMFLNLLHLSKRFFCTFCCRALYLSGGCWLKTLLAHSSCVRREWQQVGKPVHQPFSVPTFATQHCLKPFKFSKHQYHCDADLHILYSDRAGSTLRNFWFPAEPWDPQTMIWSVIPLHTDLDSGFSYFTLVSSFALLAFPSCIG